MDLTVSVRCYGSLIKMRPSTSRGRSKSGPKHGESRSNSSEVQPSPNSRRSHSSLSSSSSFETFDSELSPSLSLFQGGDPQPSFPSHANIRNVMDTPSTYPLSSNGSHMDFRDYNAHSTASSLSRMVMHDKNIAGNGNKVFNSPSVEQLKSRSKSRLKSNSDTERSAICSSSSLPEVQDGIPTHNVVGCARQSFSERPSSIADTNHSAFQFPTPKSCPSETQCDRDTDSHATSSVINSRRDTPSLLVLNAQTLHSDTQQQFGPSGPTYHYMKRSNSRPSDTTKISMREKKPLSRSYSDWPNEQQIAGFDCDSVVSRSRSRPVVSVSDLDSGPSSSPANLESHTGSSAPSTSRSNEPSASALSYFSRFQSRFSPKDSNQTVASQPTKPLHYSQPNISSRMSDSGMRQQKSSNDLESLRQALEHKLERDNVKTKMISVWNNIKYGWTFKGKSNLKLDTPIFLLGESYHKRSENDDYAESEFMKDFTSRIWFTYRSNFYPIPGTKLKTDCGWGCMLRSGQMLVAQCLVTHFLGREWRMYDQQTHSQLAFYKEIIRWFSDPIDSPSDHVPLSLHHLVQLGRSYNKIPGEWYGPASVAFILRDALNKAGSTMPILRQLCVYVAQDCTVYIDDIMRLCRSRGKSDSNTDSLHTTRQAATDESQQSIEDDGSWLRSLIVLIPVRLGGEVMNEIYSPCIQRLLSYSHCMGIIGGKPKHSLYFIGYQEEKLIYLDPHYCRDAIDTKANNFPIETYHCMSPRKLSFSRMDPSCTIGFYIKNAEEFEQFTHEVQEYISPPRQRGSYPLFIFSKGSHEDASHAHEMAGIERGRVRVRHYRVDENGQRQPETLHESEDFVMLG